MFEGIKNGWDLIKASIKVFNHYPKFVAPLLITWLIYAPIILYLKYGFNWDTYATPQVLLIVFGVIFVFAFLLAFSSSMLLELIQQLEAGQKMSLGKAFEYTFKQNLIKIIPIVFVWTIIWFILIVIQALLSKRRGKDEEESITAENAAKTLADYQNLSISSAFFKALNKGVRMIVFLILPAIAWENLGFAQATKKGFAVFKVHLSEFVTGFVLTEAVAGIIFFPPILLFFITGKTHITLPDYIWYITIVYIAFAWSYSIYLEQMFTAYLYLWHMKWKREASKAEKENKPIPSMINIPRPSVLDEVNDLLDK